MQADVAEKKETEIGDIPTDWEVSKIIEVCDTTAGGTPSRKKLEYYEGEIPWFKSGELNDGLIDDSEEKVSQVAIDESSAKLFPKGTILIAMYGATAGKTAKLGIDAATNQAICAIFPDETKLDGDFLQYNLIHSRNELLKNKHGGAQSNLNQGMVKNHQIPLPALTEQQEIASALSTVRDAIEQTEAVIQATRELKKSMMKHLFTYGPVPVDQTDQVELKKTDIGPIPSSWELVEVDEVFNFSRKQRSLDIEKDDKIPFIPMENISKVWNEIDLYQEKKWSEINSGSYVEKGDLIVAKITPSFENGKQAMLNDLPNKFGYATTEIWALHPNEKKRVLPELLFYYLKKSSIRNSIANKMEGSTGRQRVPKSVLIKLLIPLPNLETQKKIVDDFLILDNKVKQESDKIESLKSLFNSLLENLMTAKVRVV